MCINPASIARNNKKYNCSLVATQESRLQFFFYDLSSTSAYLGAYVQK